MTGGIPRRSRDRYQLGLRHFVIDDVSCVAEYLARAGVALRYLPPYNFNVKPVVQVFSEIETSLQRATPRLPNAIRNVLKRLQTSKHPHCIHYFNYMKA